MLQQVFGIFFFFEVLNLQDRGGCLEGIERPQIQILGVVGGRRQLPEIAEARPVPLDQIGSCTLSRDLLVGGMEGESIAMATLGVRKQPKRLRLNRRETIGVRKRDCFRKYRQTLAAGAIRPQRERKNQRE